LKIEPVNVTADEAAEEPLADLKQNNYPAIINQSRTRSAQQKDI